MRCRLCRILFLPLTFCIWIGAVGETEADAPASVVSRTTDSTDVWVMVFRVVCPDRLREVQNQHSSREVVDRKKSRVGIRSVICE